MPIILKPLLGPLEEKHERNKRLFTDPKFRSEYASLLEELRSLEVEGGRELSVLLLNWANWDEPESAAALADRMAEGMAQKGWEHEAAERRSMAAAIRAITHCASAGIYRQSLLRYSEREGPDPLNRIQKEGMAEKLASLCKYTTDKSFSVVMDSGTASGE
jgi:hypothetical protein